MKTTTHRLLAAASLLALLLAPLAARAQAVPQPDLATTGTTVPAVTPARQRPIENRESKIENPQDDVIHLAPFTVSDSSQTGYTASESMTGTRMPTKVMDLPFNIDMVTSQFFDDFDVTDPSIMYEGGVVWDDLDAGGGQTIRGISSVGMLYNGFWLPSGVSVPTKLVERMEILKGPSASIYGQTTPGGIVNIITKQPKSKKAQNVSVSLGDYTQRRASVNLTGPIVKGTNYLVNLSYDDRYFQQPWRRNKTLGAALSVAHNFGSNTKLTVEMTAIQQRNNTPSNRVPYYCDSNNNVVFTAIDPNSGLTASGTTNGYYTDYAWSLAKTSAVGPYSYKNTDTYAIFATLETRLNEIFSARLAANFVASPNDSFNTTALTRFDDIWSNASAGDFSAGISGNPYANNIYGVSRVRSDSSSYSAPSLQQNRNQSGGIQGDLLARYYLANKKIECRTMLSFDFSSLYNNLHSWNMPTNINKSNANGSPGTQSVPDPLIFPWDPSTIDYANPNNPAPGKVSPAYFWANYWLPVVDPLNPHHSPYVNMDDPTAPYYVPNYDIYHVPQFSTDKWELQRIQHSRRDVMGFMLRQQFTIGKVLNLYAALRRDDVAYHYYIFRTPSWSPKVHPEYAAYYIPTVDASATWHSGGWTPSTGFNYRPIRWLAFYGNFSTSFNPSNQTVSGATTSITHAPNQTAWGYDYGIKFQLMSNRLTGYVGGFYIAQNHLDVSEWDEAAGTTIHMSVGQVLSRGLEISTNYDITNGISVKAGYYHTNAKYTNAGYDHDLVGRSMENVPPDIITLTPKVSIQSGFFKGLAIACTWQYGSTCPSNKNGGQAVSLPSTAAPAKYSVIPPGANNGLRELRVPVMSRIDLSVSYGFKAGFGLFAPRRQSISLVVRNLTNVQYVTTSRGISDDRSFTATYNIQF